MRHSSLYYGVLSTAILAVVVGVAFRPAAISAGRGETNGSAEMSLEQLVSEADRIFLGKVETVRRQPWTEKRDGVAARVVARFVVFDPIVRLKGVPDSEKVNIRQYDAFADGVAEGQEVLWFLAPRNAAGYDNPVGKFSGYFRVLPDSNAPGGKVVVNLVHNRGLWGMRLWDDHMFSRTLAKTCIYLQKFDEDVRESIVGRGDRPPEGEPVPLELMLAAIHTRVQPH